MSAKLVSRIFVATLFALTLVVVSFGSRASAQIGSTVSESRVGMIENLGQWDADALFRMESGDANLWLRKEGLIYNAADLRAFAPEVAEVPSAPASEEPLGEAPDPQLIDQHAVRVNFVGGDASLISGRNQIPGVYNWLGRDVEVSGARQFGTVVYADLYPGVNAMVAGPQTDSHPNALVKTTYEVLPTGDHLDIVLEYEGADSLSLDEEGNLVIETTMGEFVEQAPVAWQLRLGKVEPLPVKFVLDVINQRVTFDVDGRTPGATLYIDPIVLFSSRFGGSSTDGLQDMHEDATARYFTGHTLSTNFPTTAGAFRVAFGGSVDMFASKFNLANDTLIWSTYLGDLQTDYGGHSALSAIGELYVVGTNSNGPTLTTSFSYGTLGGYDVTMFRLAANGASLVSSVKWGGTSTDHGHNPVLAPNGDVYVVGAELSTTATFPFGGGGVDLVNNGSYDGFVSRFNSNFSAYLNGTLVASGSSNDVAHDVVFFNNEVYVTGTTIFSAWPGTLIGSGGGNDVTMYKYNSTLTSQLYAVAIGGSSTEPTAGTGFIGAPPTFLSFGYNGLAVDATGQAWVTGMSASTNFPIGTNTPFQPANGGNYDVFVFSLNPTGTAIVNFTFVGGTSTDTGRDIGFDVDGNVYVVGSAASTNYPVVNAEQATNGGGTYDFIRSILSPDLSDLLCSTYYGAAGTDYGASLIVGPAPYTARIGGSSSASFPLIPAGRTVFGGGGGFDIGVASINCGGALLGIENEVFTPVPTTHDFDCLTAGDFVRFNFDVVNSGLSDQPDNPGPEFQGTFRGPMIPQSCIASSGTCVLSGGSVIWDGAIASGESVSFEIFGRVAGGVRAGTEICLVGILNFDAGTGTNGESLEFELCTITDCPPTVVPNAQLGCQVHLPILDFLGMDDLCESWIEVQNLGCDFAKASLVTWGEPGFCPPQAAGPLKVECTGLLKPGSTWNLLGAQIPNGSKSGILFKWTARQLSEIGVDLGFDDVVADYMCETLFFGVVGDADDYRRFKKAYNEGLDFGGVPMDRAMGDGLLAVDVHRKCPGDVTPGVEVTSKYNGIAGTHLGTFDPVFGGHSYYVPLVYADKAGFTSIMYIQNGGLECTSVEVWFKTQDDCLRAKICDISTLAPGETYQLDANDCVGPDFQGSAWIRTTQPMGIAVDIVGRDVLMTYVAEPGEINYTFDPTKSLTKDGNQVAFGPLIYSEYQGWDTGVQVQNLSAVTAAKVKVYFLDRSGGIITTLVDWICPRGSQTFFLPVIFDLPGNWVGNLRVESQEWISPGGPLVQPPNVVGVVTLIKYNDAARTETTEAIAYNLLPEHKIFDWQIGFGRGGLDSGIGLIAIPSLLKDLDGSGLTSELAITNVVPKPGFTDFAIYFFDQNGLLDYVCQKLNEKQTEYIDLQTWGYVNPGFKGSAIISATFWEHDVFDDRGNFVRNLLGLGAVAIERNGTRLGEDAPGDEAAGSRGIPFTNPRTLQEEEDGGFEHCFMADFPICPGTPFTRPDAEACQGVGLGSFTLDIELGPPFSMFPRGPGTCINTGVNARNFGTHEFSVCEGTSEVTLTIDAVTLSPFNGASCGIPGQDLLISLHFGPNGFDPTASCSNWIQSNSDNFQAMGPGDSFTFSLPEAPGDYTLMMQNNCDTTPPSSSGTVDFTLE